MIRPLSQIYHDIDKEEISKIRKEMKKRMIKMRRNYAGEYTTNAKSYETGYDLGYSDALGEFLEWMDDNE